MMTAGPWTPQRGGAAAIHPPGALPDGRLGLSVAEAARRLAQDGPNALPPPPKPSIARQLAAQLFHFFAVMLWIAGALAVVADMAALGVAIFVVILVNAAFAFAQERRADRAAERLRQLLPQQVTLRRDGEIIEVDAAGVVRGDLLILAAGDRVPADAELLASAGLRVDRSMLTGESVAAAVATGEPIHAGTFVVDGEGEAVVTATGSGTRLAAISRLTVATHKPESPLTGELRRVVHTIALVAVGVGVAFLGLSTLLGMGFAKALVFAIGVIVALVPEGLLPTVTLSLSLGAQRMARQNALVRRLDAVETLGSTTFICTDKTGTLTRNEMAVVEAWTPAGTLAITGHGYEPTAELRYGPGADPEAFRRLARAGARCSTGRAIPDGEGWRARGDPMEAALDAFARRVGFDIDADRAAVPDRWRLPFDSVRKQMTVALEDGTLVLKGAVEAVLAICADPGDAAAVAQAYADHGLRVLAIAVRSRPHGEGSDPTGEAHDPADADGNPPTEPRDGFELLGLAAFADPPRTEARAAIDACRHAGIRVAMLTGDHPATALAIAREVGLAGADSAAIVGADLPADEAALGALVDFDGVVLARITPEDKLRIARALRARGHVLAMTGDGVNDGPALHEADIGVAMGRSGTDVAREAADLVLMDDNFATIVAAIEHGRATFFNIRRFLTYHLTDNVAELTPYLFWALSGGSFPLALSVLQILAIDIGTDTATASALGAEAPRSQVLDRPPVSGRLLDRTAALRAFGILGPTEALFEMAIFTAVLVAGGWWLGGPAPGATSLAAASGAAFMTVVVAQHANAWACRSVNRPPWRLGWTSNRLLLATASAEMAFAFAVLLIPPIAALLGQSVPPAWSWPLILASAPAVIAVDALWKALRRGRPPGD